MKEGWEYKKLGEVCDIYQPKTISGKDLVEDGKYLVYGANGVIGKYNSYNHERSEVLMTCRGATCGTINVSEPYSWINGNAMVVHPQHNILSQNFLFYLLKGLDLSDVITGAAQPQITRQSLVPKKIAIPPLSEQQHIVEELDLLSGIIEKKKKQLKELDNLAESIFYDMFGEPIENPKGWKIIALKQVLKVVGGYAFKSDEFKENGIPVLRIGNINLGVFRPTNMVFWEKTEKLRKYLIFPNDLVMSLTGTVGKSDYGNVCILDNSYNEYYLNQRNAKLEIIGGVDKFYLSNILRFDAIKTRLTSVSRGVRQANISNKDIENLKIPLPPLSLQQSFAEKIEAIEKQKELIKQSIKEVETLFNSRMDYYFN